MPSAQIIRSQGCQGPLEIFRAGDVKSYCSIRVFIRRVMLGCLLTALTRALMRSARWMK